MHTREDMQEGTNGTANRTNTHVSRTNIHARDAVSSLAHCNSFTTQI